MPVAAIRACAHALAEANPDMETYLVGGAVRDRLLTDEEVVEIERRVNAAIVDNAPIAPRCLASAMGSSSVTIGWGTRGLHLP